MPEVWHVLIQRDNNVTLLKNLTADLCGEVVRRLCPGTNPWHDLFIPARAEWKFDPKAYHTARKAEYDERVRQHMSMVAGMGAHYYPLTAPIKPASFDYAETLGEYEGVEWWGPDGEELEIWPKPADYDAKLAAAIEAHRLAASINSNIDKAA